jgi:hypothetical protein
LAADTVVHSYSGHDRRQQHTGRKTNTVVTCTDISHSSEARVQKVAALAKGIRELCPRLDDIHNCTSGPDEDQFSSELGTAVWDLIHPDEMRNS